MPKGKRAGQDSRTGSGSRLTAPASAEARAATSRMIAYHSDASLAGRRQRAFYPTQQGRGGSAGSISTALSQCAPWPYSFLGAQGLG